MKKSLGFLVGLASFTLFSCNNEVDLTGDYEDMPVIYSLLNVNDSVHQIRIQKAFLINANVLQTAQIPDSLTYDPADLIVEIQAYDPATGQVPPVSNVNHSPLVFQYVPGATQDTGAFAQDGIMIYRAARKLSAAYEYHLTVTNTKLNRQITAKTPLITTTLTFMKKPNPTAGLIAFNNPGGSGYEIQWVTVANGFVYQPEIIFKWRERDLNTGILTPDSLVWTLTPREASSDNPGEEMSFILPQNSFYRYVGENLEPRPSNIERLIGTVSFKFYIGSEDLNTYINVNKPSIGLIQEKPVYTNITNGLGLFASRTTYLRKDYSFTEAAKDTLIFSPLTNDLNFKKF